MEKIAHSKVFIWILRILGVFGSFAFLIIPLASVLLPADSPMFVDALLEWWFILFNALMGLFLLFPLKLIRKKKTAKRFFQAFFTLAIIQILNTFGYTPIYLGFILLPIVIGNVWAAYWKLYIISHNVDRQNKS